MLLQAQDRCHRIGQTREVRIYRLVSEKTIEENILTKSDQKRQLDHLAIQSGGFNTEFLQKFNPRELLGVQPGGSNPSPAPPLSPLPCPFPPSPTLRSFFLVPVCVMHWSHYVTTNIDFCPIWLIYFSSSSTCCPACILQIHAGWDGYMFVGLHNIQSFLPNNGCYRFCRATELTHALQIAAHMHIIFNY